MHTIEQTFIKVLYIIFAFDYLSWREKDSEKVNTYDEKEWKLHTVLQMIMELGLC